MTKIVTIVGQGYVGLPLAQEATRAGWQVNGYDINQGIIQALEQGKSHVDDLSDSDIEEMLYSGYRPTASPEAFQGSDVIVVCVPTPLHDSGAPDLSAVVGAMRAIAENLSKGTLIVLESTTYPGTTDEICKPLIEQISGFKCGEDFYLAFSPERVDPGSKLYNIKNTPKLVGGVDDESTDRAHKFYSEFIDNVIKLAGAREAETAKLLENTFRHVNIALVNEMAKFCHELDIDIWEVIRGASTKPFGFMRFNPGPGVGGHCIPIDPNYLSHEVRRRLGYPFHFVELAQEINSSMPAYVVTRISELLNNVKKPLNGSRILLLGVTYKPDIADQRESPALPLGNLLIRAGADLEYYDPYVPEWNLKDRVVKSQPDLTKAVSQADIVVIIQNHSVFDIQAILNSASIVFDTRGVAPSPAISI